jgi:glycosyltransferase involved in cell wall biosynthesis
MALTVGYDATAAVRQGAGIGRYARELLAALARRTDDVHYKLLSSSGGVTEGYLPRLDGRFRHRALPVSDRVTNVFWQRWHVGVPVQTLIGCFDLFHSPDFTLPPTARRPAVVTVHDLAFLRVPEAAYPSLREYLEVVVPRSARRAERVIAVSQRTADDLVELLGIPAARIAVIPEGVSAQFVPVGDTRKTRAELELYGIRKPYVLAVGTLEPRKNYVRLFSAYARLRARGYDGHLVVAGRRGWLYEPILAAIRKLGLASEIKIIHPRDQDLPALYSLAEAFVYPSLYEGFGIPPLEAMACGTAVACSAASSLPEVVGDAALLFDPLDEQQICDSVERLLSDEALRAHLIERGRARAETFTWDRTAERTVTVYQEVAGRA